MEIPVNGLSPSVGNNQFSSTIKDTQGEQEKQIDFSPSKMTSESNIEDLKDKLKKYEKEEIVAYSKKKESVRSGISGAVSQAKNESKAFLLANVPSEVCALVLFKLNLRDMVTFGQTSKFSNHTLKTLLSTPSYWDKIYHKIIQDFEKHKSSISGEAQVIDPVDTLEAFKFLMGEQHLLRTVKPNGDLSAFINAMFEMIRDEIDITISNISAPDHRYINSKEYLSLIHDLWPKLAYLRMLEVHAEPKDIEWLNSVTNTLSQVKREEALRQLGFSEDYGVNHVFLFDPGMGLETKDQDPYNLHFLMISSMDNISKYLMCSLCSNLEAVGGGIDYIISYNILSEALKRRDGGIQVIKEAFAFYNLKLNLYYPIMIEPNLLEETDDFDSEREITTKFFSVLWDKGEHVSLSAQEYTYLAINFLLDRQFDRAIESATKAMGIEGVEYTLTLKIIGLAANYKEKLLLKSSALPH